MISLSALKSCLLAGADGFNAVVGGPQPFKRSAHPDPAGQFEDDRSRRNYIAASADNELAVDFVRDGVFFAQKPNDLGDAAIWQGVYAAMCVMRWKAQPSTTNQEAMHAAATALSRYFYPTGPSQAILVRGAVPVALEHDFFHIDPNNGAHYFTDACDGQAYAYRDDASLDSLLGVMFGAAIIRRFGDDDACAVLATPLHRFAGAFTAAGHRLTRRDGTPTKYGDCAPGLFQAPVRILAAALPSLVAPSWADDWRGIAKAYAPEFARTDTQIPGRISWVNAHLAMLATLTFVAAAPAGAPGLEEAKAGLRTLLEKYSDAGNAFLVYAAAALGVTPTKAQLDKAEKVLLEFPVGPKRKSGFHTSVAPALEPVPAWQRPPADIFWQRSPYPYLGSETNAYSRLDYLVAHYFQRSA